MKYLKLYERFSSDINMNGDKEQTIKEICLELDEMGANIRLFKDSFYAYYKKITIYNFNEICSSKELSWGVVKEYLLRLIDYLGDDYVKFRYMVGNPSRRNYGAGDWEEIEFDEEIEFSDIYSNDCSTMVSIVYR